MSSLQRRGDASVPTLRSPRLGLERRVPMSGSRRKDRARFLLPRQKGSHCPSSWSSAQALRGGYGRAEEGERRCLHAEAARGGAGPRAVGRPGAAPLPVRRRAGRRASRQLPPCRALRNLFVASHLLLAASPGAGHPRRPLSKVSHGISRTPRGSKNHPETLAGWNGGAAEPHEARVTWPWRGAARGLLLAVVRNQAGRYWCSGWGATANPALGTICGALGGWRPGVGSAGTRRGEPASPRRTASPPEKPVARATSLTPAALLGTGSLPTANAALLGWNGVMGFIAGLRCWLSFSVGLPWVRPSSWASRRLILCKAGLRKLLCSLVRRVGSWGTHGVLF